MVSWQTLPSAKRARIKQAVVAAVAPKLAALAGEESTDPPEVEAVAVTGTDAELTVHFVAHLMMHSASLDSDDAEHVIYVGHAVTGPDRPVTITEIEEHREALRGPERAEYDPAVVLQRVREQILARIRGQPVPDASDEGARARKVAAERQRTIAKAVEATRPPEPASVMRCPRCGSTRAEPVDRVEEYIVMTCPACGLRAFVENDEVSTDWMVPIVLAPGEAVPAFLAPLPPRPVEPPAVSVAPPPARVRDTSPAPVLADEERDGWTNDVTDPPLRCPRCDSTDVYDDAGRAARHFTFLACRRCDHGEEIDSLTAAARWRRT